ncbi:MAG: oligopeptide/dipeptide ABC transporter ATP-binding protein [Candidatus Limivivens sp.]|nr:oligopeptide/dipeptide ABC transporter ATP-binding protein [Candidatus Limivivens sp.]
MEKKNVLLSVKDLEVKFRVRGRILSAIRGVSLDIYEDESIAIVGESGAGKSVFTKAFAGMLDSNGFVSNGSIIFNDPELSDTVVKLNSTAWKFIDSYKKQLDENSRLELGSATYRKMLELESEMREKSTLSAADKEKEEKELHALKVKRTETFNKKQTLDPAKEKAEIKAAAAEIKKLDAEIKALEKATEQKIKEHKNAVAHDAAYQKSYQERMEKLKKQYAEETSKDISDSTKKRNETLAKEVYLSVGRYKFKKRFKMGKGLIAELKKAMQLGVDLNSEEERNQVFGNVTFRVRYLDENSERLHGTCIINLAQVKDQNDWGQIRGKKIATVFQDPMTSLNPIITIGKQITSIIMKHQGCSEVEARAKALEMMEKVGIPNAEARFDDYPFQYSGGMRQRIVIAIALSCQPKILICDEPTTALDVTIQAQILKLIKDLQKEYHYTIVFITHDLGVVANIADRVAVLYAGQIIELATVEELFYDPRHPYTWALLSSLPQLAERNTKLYSITGTPPSLYNKIVGDSFAPRNPYCLKIDTLAEPPMFKVSETHYAKTWLLEPNAPKVEKPEIIQDIHEKLLKAYHI